MHGAASIVRSLPQRYVVGWQGQQGGSGAATFSAQNSACLLPLNVVNVGVSQLNSVNGRQRLSGRGTTNLPAVFPAQPTR